MVTSWSRAVRRVRHEPGAALAPVLILGLGIGLNAATFSVVNAVLYSPLPVREPQELVSVYVATADQRPAAGALSSDDYNDLTDAVRDFQDLAAYTYSPMVVERESENRLAVGVRATSNYFSMLGVEPHLGRYFRAEEDQDSGIAVLSYGAWKRRFGGRSGVVGTTFRLNGRLTTVVGVSPPSFPGLTRGVAPELWTPMGRRLGAGVAGSREFGWLWVVGRLRSGAQLDGAQRQLDRLSSRIAAESLATVGRRDFVAYPAQEVRVLPGFDSRLTTASMLLLVVVGLVLLITCANVANLLFARGLARQREMATYRALGASSSDLVQQVLAEVSILVGLGVALGWLIAGLANVAVGALRLPLPIDLELGLSLDRRVLAFTLGVGALVTVAAGLAPALAAARGDIVSGLRVGAGASGGRRQRRWSAVLVVFQVGLCLALLVGMFLTIRSLSKIRHADLGFAPSDVVVASVAPRLQGFARQEVDGYLERLTERVRRLPGVEVAALASHLPLNVELAFERVAVAETADSPDRWPEIDAALVDPGYFEALRVPLLAGRYFTEGDQPLGVPVAVVNESFARRFWPGQVAVGRAVRLAGISGQYEVVGVVGDGKYRTLAEAPRPYFYRVLRQGRWLARAKSGQIGSGTETLVVRVSATAPATVEQIRRVLREVDPRVAVARLEPLTETLRTTLFLPKAAVGAFSVFAAVGLATALSGTYWLAAVTAASRRREFAIRRALGASRWRIVGHHLSRTLGWGALGVGLGLLLAAVGARGLRSLLYGVEPGDPGVLASSAMALSVLLLACVLAAVRGAVAESAASVLRGD